MFALPTGSGRIAESCPADLHFFHLYGQNDACRSRKFGGAVAFVCQHQELVLPVPAPSITLGSKGCQHALAPFLIGRPEPLDIAGREPPSRDLAASDPHHLRPVGLLRPVGFVQHLSGYQMQAKQNGIPEGANIDARHAGYLLSL
jgi:hypothetical protein